MSPVIERVELTRWRRHSHFDHQFEPGLNFVLGPNGHGKTSLLEGIRFALLGEAGVAKFAVRDLEGISSAKVWMNGQIGGLFGHTASSLGEVVPISDSRSTKSQL